MFTPEVLFVVLEASNPRCAEEDEGLFNLAKRATNENNASGLVDKLHTLLIFQNTPSLYSLNSVPRAVRKAEHVAIQLLYSTAQW